MYRQQSTFVFSSNAGEAIPLKKKEKKDIYHI